MQDFCELDSIVIKCWCAPKGYCFRTIGNKNNSLAPSLASPCAPIVFSVHWTLLSFHAGNITREREIMNSRRQS